MLTSSECRSESARFSELAELSVNAMIRDDYLALATSWLRVAAMADEQDRITAANQPIISG